MTFSWTFDPVLVSIGPVAVRWYGLLFVAAFLLGQAMLARMFAAEGVARDKAEKLLLHALLGAIVGARLVHCLFYEPAYYLANPLAILRIWEGGLASHGGVMGVLLGMWLASRRFQPQLPFLWILDRAAIPAAFGAAIIRVANFLNSEIVGVPTSGEWGVIFTAIDQSPRHPVQAYEALAYAAIGCLLWAMYRRTRDSTPQGRLVGWLLVLVFSARLFLEAWKIPQAAYETGQGLSVGQYLSLPFIALGVALVWWSTRQPRPASQWQLLAATPNVPMARVMAGLLAENDVPCRIDTGPALLGDAQSCYVMVESHLLAQAQQLTAASSFSEAELEFLATGQHACDDAREK